MPAEMYYDNDADLSLLQDKTIGIIGYGSQGHAHALNCKDNGLNVMVGLYDGSKSREKAEADGLRVGAVDETAEESDIVMVLIPDHLQADVYKQEIAPHLGVREDPDVRSRLQHPLRHHRARGEHRCIDGSAEGSRP